MRSLAIALSVLVMAVHIKMEDMNILDDILIYPIPAPVSANIQKRDTGKDSSDDFNQFVEEKLTQHTQALEYIVKTMDRREKLNKVLFDFITRTEKPSLPEKIEIERSRQLVARRSNSNDEEKDSPVLKIGKNIPKYGRLAKDLFLKEIQSATDPTPLVETNPDDSAISEVSRRSFGGGPGMDTFQQIKDEPSQWCQAAVLCKKTAESICGFDDNYGYGKFDDICHMLHVNCYYKYNFALMYTCHPMI